MLQLMSKDPRNRLGVGEDGFAQLVTHPWFHEIDWRQLEQQALTPPFCPDVSKMGSVEFKQIHTDTNQKNATLTTFLVQESQF